MTGETTRFRNPAGRAGLVNNLLAFLNALAGFLESRLALLAKESKAALVQAVLLVVCLLGALLLFAFGYVFLIASAVVGLARALQVSWLWVALVAAGLHFLFALICLLIARTMMTKPPFRELTAELRKDREWLKNLDETSRPAN
jgi:uncharacterized membrane protein YqjE